MTWPQFAILACLHALTLLAILAPRLRRPRVSVARRGQETLQPGILAKLTGAETEAPKGYGDELLGKPKDPSKRWRA